jgi:antibiotic biosynthesis monooxygenase (ABM) superfamily enzyme
MHDDHLDDTSLTIVIRRHARPGKEKDLEAWIEGISSAVRHFDGYLGTNVIKPPSPDSTEYVSIFRFDTYENLCRWYDSDVRADWLFKVKDLIEGEPTIQRVEGMHYWFDLSDVATTSAPPRWKMALIITLALYPLGLGLGYLFSPIADVFHPQVLRIVVLSIAVALMTWLIMPALTHLLRGWLFGR